MTRIAFLGTPLAAVPALRALAEDVVVVVTRPDQPKGRSRIPQPSPVKVAALDLRKEIAQPSTADELATTMRRWAPEVAVVVAYGKIIPGAALEVPESGFLNIHFSLLPRWRGAAPVERAILAGDHETGVTIIRLDEGLDTGPVLARRRVEIDGDIDAAALTEGLATMGARLIAETLPVYLSGSLLPLPQRDDDATYARRFETAEARLDLSLPADHLARVVRASTSRGGAYAFDHLDRLKIWRARPVSQPVLGRGQVAFVEASVFVGTGEGSLEVVEVQPSGGRRMGAAEWARGHRPDILS
jgi:methionyl-tRNA formyltransferase